MTRQNRINKQSIGLLGSIVGGLMLSVPAISLPASAQTTSSDFMSEAYCPGVYIFYVEGYNQTDLSRCPLSQQELRLREQQQELSDERNGMTNFENSPNDIQPILFEDQQNFMERTTSGDFENLSRQ